MSDSVLGPLGGTTVVDLSDEKGAYCTKLLADLGARVIKIEPPSGDRMRHIPPFKDSVPDVDGSLTFAYYHANKESVTLDLGNAASRQILRRLLSMSDVLLESYTATEAEARELTFDALAGGYSDLVHCSITAFGKTGPYRNFRSTHLISNAMGGGLIGQGPPDGPPTTLPGNQYFDLTGAHAAAAVLVALRSRAEVGGQSIDMSTHEVMANLNRLIPGYWLSGSIVRRAGGGRQPPSGTWDCSDGQIELTVVNPSQWQGVPELVGNPEELGDPAWANRSTRMERADELTMLLERYFRQRPKAELAERAQALHIPAAPINTIGDYVEDPQPRSRGFWVQIEHPILGSYLTTGSPFGFSDPMWSLCRPAPTLGEQNQAIYVNELGFSSDQVASWRAAGVI